jgi:hypothetical protein
MEQRSLGSLSVSVIGLGTNNFRFFVEPDDVPAVVDEALEVGINFFDTADAAAPGWSLGLGRRGQIIGGLAIRAWSACRWWSRPSAFGSTYRVPLFQPGDDSELEGDVLAELRGPARDVGRQLRDLLINL